MAYAWPASTRSRRPGTLSTFAIAAATSAGGMPRQRPAVAAPARFESWNRPSSGEAIGSRPPGYASSNATPDRSQRPFSARNSASAPDGEKLATRRRDLREKPGSGGVVHVDDRAGPGLAQREEALLGLVVGLHVAVKIEMVARQVREDGDVEAAALHAVERERVGGDLHRRGARPVRDHLGQQLLDQRRFRRGAVRLDAAAPRAIADRPEKPGGAVPPREDRLEQRRRRGLAVGARHGREHELLRRISVQARRQQRERPPRRGDA